MFFFRGHVIFLGSTVICFQQLWLIQRGKPRFWFGRWVYCSLVVSKIRSLIVRHPNMIWATKSNPYSVPLSWLVNRDSYMQWLRRIPITKCSTVQSPIYLGCGPLPVTVTTRIIAYLVGDSYKPSFATVTGRGPHPIYPKRTRCVFFHCSCPHDDGTSKLQFLKAQRLLARSISKSSYDVVGGTQKVEWFFTWGDGSHSVANSRELQDG